jgi:cardiolipin synthase
MRLIVQPDDGAAPLIRAIQRARKTVDAVIFRLDLDTVENSLKRAVGQGVAVRALIAHTNRGGEKELRKLERRLLKAGVMVARTDTDLIRYHGKLLLIDGRRLYVMGFNYTKDDLESRSFGVLTRSRKLIAEAARLIEADSNRQTFKSSPRGLVVSPENARQRLARFIRKARRELLIYDPNVSDDEMLQLLKTRANAGVKIRILGKLEKKWMDRGFKVRKFPGRLHVRALIRDGRRAFVGSQSLRKLELDERREIGIVIRDQRLVKRLANVFAADWAKAKKKKK